MTAPPQGHRPGLTKVRSIPLLRKRSVHLFSSQAGVWKEIVDSADVVSEGLTRIEGGVPTYYGSTSVVLMPVSSGGSLPDLELAHIAAVVRFDPHVRLRVLRIAHREATLRAGAPLGTMRADINVDAGARGVSLLVEVVARLSRSHVSASSSGDR